MALLGLAALGGGSSQTAVPLVGEESTMPIRLDITVTAPGTLQIDTREAQVIGTANLTFRGTLDNPSLTGRITLDRGQIFFSGNRYTLGPSSIDFSNPSRIEPFFDIDFETRPRVAGESYNVTIRVTGTTATPNGLSLSLASEPFLPDSDLLALLLGQQLTESEAGTRELRTVQSSQQAQQQLLRNAAAQFLTMPISSRVGSVVQRTTPCDTFSIIPLVGAQQSIQNLTATASLTCSKRISDRVFFTYSRYLDATQYELILLEYEQSDRVSWVLSRNEGRTFALDFRVRRVF